jgi:hypothetical protein
MRKKMYEMNKKEKEKEKEKKTNRNFDAAARH